jgi:hypothetical protein
MIKVCAGHARTAGRPLHLWIEVYVRISGARTWAGSWTRGLGWDGSVIDQPFRAVTRTL